MKNINNCAWFIVGIVYLLIIVLSVLTIIKMTNVISNNLSKEVLIKKGASVVEYFDDVKKEINKELLYRRGQEKPTGQIRGNINE